MTTSSARRERNHVTERMRTLASRVILTVAFFHQGATIPVVVLAGFEHRYYLMKGLASQAVKEGFVLRSFQEY